MKIKEWFAKLTDRNWKTWVGHSLWGVVAGLGGLTLRALLLWLPARWMPGPPIVAELMANVIALSVSVSLLTGAFLLRELDNAFFHGLEEAKEDGVLAVIKAAWKSFAEDGYFDLVSPYVGYGLPIAFVWTPIGLAVFGLGSAGVIFGHRWFKGRWIWDGVD